MFKAAIDREPAHKKTEYYRINEFIAVNDTSAPSACLLWEWGCEQS